MSLAVELVCCKEAEICKEVTAELSKKPGENSVTAPQAAEAGGKAVPGEECYTGAQPCSPQEAKCTSSSP